MRPICSFASFLQSTYSLACGNVAHSQSPRKTFHFIPRRVNISVCVCVCVCVCVHVPAHVIVSVHVCMCVEETEQEISRILSGPVERPFPMPANHSEDEPSARPVVQPNSRPNSARGVFPGAWPAPRLWQPPRAAVSGWQTGRCPTR